MPHEKRSYKRVPTKLIVLWEGLSTNNIALMTNISLVRILMMVNSDYGERFFRAFGAKCAEPL